jgi:hypothetical protein
VTRSSLTGHNRNFPTCKIERPFQVSGHPMRPQPLLTIRLLVIDRAGGLSRPVFGWHGWLLLNRAEQTNRFVVT